MLIFPGVVIVLQLCIMFSNKYYNILGEISDVCNVFSNVAEKII